MSKNPDFAECKTRLKSLLSREERVYITKHMLDITCSVVSKFNTASTLHLFPSKDGMFIKELSEKYNITPQVQKIGMLSDKIYSILNQDNLTFKKKLVIGADIPSISVNEISDCINLLNKYDCVFGPSNDEGFYLVGTKANAHLIFKNLNMDTILVNSLIAICEKNKISYKLIRELKDIDCEKDLLFI
tara:strand:- start:544 stop:1107 length:564 start_codon:yes stop_codon:yes gene_type:complete